MPVDVVISPEQLVTENIEQLIHYPGRFPGARVCRWQGTAGWRAGAWRGGLMVGQEIRALTEHLPNVEARVAAIYRNGYPVQPEGDTVIQGE